MPDAPMLDTLIKLAALGTSGVCILAIFWAGWTIQKTTRAGEQAQKTVRTFMLAAVGIAVISAASGALNAYFNAQAVNACQEENDRRAIALVAQQDTLQQMISDLTPLLENRAVSNAAAASPALRPHLRDLQEVVRPR
jgi:formate hydrogenlyase subunit 3/multisubunit Na+/H+ antiporter MnhD subunit